MMLECPICKGLINSNDFKVVRGSRGGFNCPACGKMLHLAQGWRPLRITLAVCVSLLAVLLVGVRRPLVIAMVSLMFWPFVQLLVNAYSVHFVPQGLKPWKPPADHSENVADLPFDPWRRR
jgi:hypothetical protein